MGPRAIPHPGRRRTVLAVSSGGGHWVQLLRLRPPRTAPEARGARAYGAAGVSATRKRAA